jgi:hypothetical protein
LYIIFHGIIHIEQVPAKSSCSLKQWYP